MSQKFHTLTTDFSAGEISDDYAAAQVGNEVYRRAVERMENAFPMRSGGATRRPSTEVLTTSAWTDLDPANSFFAPFRKNDGSLVIIRCHNDTANTRVVFTQISTTTGAESSITNGTISGTSNITLSRPVQAGPSQFWTLGSEPVCRIVESTAGVLSLKEGVTAPESGDQYFFQMQGLWSYDKVVRASTIYAEPQTGTAAYDEFDGVGRIIAVGDVLVTAAPTGRTVREDEEPDPNDETSINFETLSLFDYENISDTPDDIVSFADSRLAAILGSGAGDTDYYPHAKQVDFFQGRLVIGDYSDGPRSWAIPKEDAVQVEDRVTLNFSQSGSPFIIKPGSVDPSAPIEITMFTRSGQTMNWFLATDLRIFIGMDNEIITFAGDPLTPDTINSKQTLNIGTEPTVYPIQDNNRLVFLSRGKGGVYGAEFRDAVQGFQGLELSRYAYHLVDDIVSLHLTPIVAGDPAKRLWCLKSDGTVACMAVMDDLDPRVPPAWSRVELAENLQIKALVSDADELYGIVEDPNGGSPVHALMKVLFEDTPEFVLDFKETVTGSDTDTWAVGNQYLEGEDVFAAVYDSNDVLVHTGVYTVSGNSITTDVSGDKCEFGLAFNSKIKLFDTQITDSEGPTQLRKHKVVSVNTYLKNTRAVNLSNLPLLASAPPTPGGPANSFTGTVEMDRLGWDTEHDIEFTSVAGYNFTILGISREVEI